MGGKTQKTIVEIDFTSYLFPSAEMGITFYILWKYSLFKFFLFYFYIVALFMLYQKDGQVDGRKVNAGLPLYMKYKLTFLKKLIWFF